MGKRTLGRLRSVLNTDFRSKKEGLVHEASMEAPETPTRENMMKAIVHDEYGSPDVLVLREVDKPVAKADEVLVRVLAAAVNPGDWDILHGTPYILRPMIGLMRPKNKVLGLAIAGRGGLRRSEARCRGSSRVRRSTPKPREVGSPNTPSSRRKRWL
jgi:hypothetical protein